MPKNPPWILISLCAIPFYFLVRLIVSELSLTIDLSYQDRVSKKVLSNIDKFQAVYEIAKTTPRFGISRPYMEMQEVLGELKDLKVNGCSETTKQSAIDGYSSIIEGFSIFADSSNPEFLASLKISEGETELENARSSAKTCTTRETLRRYYDKDKKKN